MFRFVKKVRPAALILTLGLLATISAQSSSTSNYLNGIAGAFGQVIAAAGLEPQTDDDAVLAIETWSGGVGGLCPVREPTRYSDRITKAYSANRKPADRISGVRI